jgi:hypothetical protein
VLYLIFGRRTVSSDAKIEGYLLLPEVSSSSDFIAGQRVLSLQAERTIPQGKGSQ